MHFSKLCTLLLLKNVSSFSPNNQISKLHHSSQKLQLSDRGWDNGNFLDALGGGQQSLDEANENYWKESQARATNRERQFQAMVHDVKFEEVIEHTVPSIDQAQTTNQFASTQQPEEYQGPSTFTPQQQQQSTTSQKQEQPPLPSQQPPMQPFNPQATPTLEQPYIQQTPPTQPTQPTQPTMDPQAYYQAIQAWQQAMVAFQQFCTANPQAASSMTPPPPPPPPPAFISNQIPPTQGYTEQQPVPPQQQTDEEPKSVYDYLPKRAGGNNDAYEVNNAADVYFAQLKRDSSVRTEARKRGDVAAANSPFSEKGVIALGGLISDELIAKRREQLAQNGGEFETSRDEMLLPSHFQGEEPVDRSYTGTSYKEKLMEAKSKRNNNNFN